MENQEKADQLEDFINDLFNTCTCNCDKCALMNVCDDLDIMNFHINNIQPENHEGYEDDEECEDDEVEVNEEFRKIYSDDDDDGEINFMG